jgi:diguanylate cyclase (GGDEF)-like protein
MVMDWPGTERAIAQPVTGPASLRALPRLGEPSAGDSLSGKAVQVISALQTTLDVERLVSLFSDAIADALPHEGILYQQPESGLQFSRGRCEGHEYGYRLRIGAEDLGELVVYRTGALRADQVQDLEYLICCLVYPLRNGLLHRHAIDSAFHDPLTGVQNRRAFNEAIRRELHLARRNGTPLTLVAVDLDNFKSINDEMGHAAGDCVLKHFVAVARDCIRGADVLFRFGGDEFVMLLNNTSLAGARRLASRLRRKLAAQAQDCVPSDRPLTVSVGVAELFDDEDEQALFDRADTALYRAKSLGRDRVCSAPARPAKRRGDDASANEA